MSKKTPAPTWGRLSERGLFPVPALPHHWGIVQLFDGATPPSLFENETGQNGKHCSAWHKVITT